MAITGDNPIRRLEDDTLGRAGTARAFAQQVLALDATRGVVVGVLGAWGSGKTSFINLTRSEFERAKVPILDFNPWMFSGAEQLVESFFIELAAELKIRPGLDEIGKNLEDYGESFSGMAWLPLVGPWIERGRGAAKILGRILQRRKEGVSKRREKLEKVLTDLGHPIVIVLDDIDRLSSPEIQQVFKLVRLTASFPNIIYVVAFDRARIESALSEKDLRGRDYLEKILQVAVDLPAVAKESLLRQVSLAVNEAVDEIENPGPFDEQVWPDLLMEIVWPFIRNMRDIRRYAAAIHGTVKALDGQVALADVLALEAVRVFAPDVFGFLHGAIEGLTTVAGDFQPSRDNPRLKAQIDRLIEIAQTHDNVVRAMIERLFPAALRHIGGSSYGRDWTSRWFRERRVAHTEIMRLYLEKAAGDDLRTLATAEQARKYLGDREKLNAFLHSVEPTRLQDVIASLEAYEEEFKPEEVVPGTVVLLNLLREIPKRKRGMFELDTSTVTARVAYRLVRSLREPSAIEIAVRSILPELTSLTAKSELVRIVGHQEGSGHKLVSERAAGEFEAVLRDEVRSAPVNDLTKEDDLMGILLFTKRKSDSSEGALNLADVPELTLAVLRSAQTEMLSQSNGSRAVRRSLRLAWDAIMELYGDEATLRTRIESLKATRPVGADDLLQLADKYLGGWRPEISRFPESDE